MKGSLRAAVLVAFLLSVAPAGAATLRQIETLDMATFQTRYRLVEQAQPGEHNRVGVTRVITPGAEGVALFERTAPLTTDVAAPSPLSMGASHGCVAPGGNLITCASLPGPPCAAPICDGTAALGWTSVTIDTGDGDDIVYATDGAAERIVCGPGFDRADVDSSDAIAADCEVVNRL